MRGIHGDGLSVNSLRGIDETGKSGHMSDLIVRRVTWHANVFIIMADKAIKKVGFVRP